MLNLEVLSNNELIATIFGIFTLGSCTILGVLGFLGKEIINNWYSRKSASHQSNLNQNLELFKVNIQNEAELFRAELQKEALEHKIKYNKLHNDRAETIKDLYSKIDRMERSMRDLFNLFEIARDNSKRDKMKVAVKNFNDTMDFYSINRIFFSEETCTIIESLRDEINLIYHEFTGYDIHLGLSEIPEVRKEQRQVWKDCWNSMKEKVPQIKRDLEKDFRRQLGVE
ncbi:hypothetical protein FZC74_16700 [Sutcliffiella horikoshii]|uniref:Uncharacterized protein n=1 Tax=Sutcliffiella horikoshii TaxID=79883 RepID=A0AA95B4T2_9BACI|nr:hypothetical protein [Sutcliffiella horikoshii]TYS57330.1 hypothetical protein FZC74_16700 [Sutcliffiella horikoshii]